MYRVGNRLALVDVYGDYDGDPEGHGHYHKLAEYLHCVYEDGKDGAGHGDKDVAGSDEDEDGGANGDG